MVKPFAVIILLLWAASGAIAEAPPNILIILTDDMGYGDVGCYGSRQIATPNIDALAASGVRCTQGYVSGFVCAPSRAGLMTGRYQNRFGFEHNLEYRGATPPEHVGLPEDQATVVELLKPFGYRTACIGKWHLGEHADWHLPNNRGFDYFFGMRNGNHTYFPTPSKNHLYRNDQRVQTIEIPYLTDWFTEEAIGFVDSVPSDEPWFLYLAYNTPHTPLQAKKEDLARFEGIKDRKRRTYCAMQHCLDENVGRLLSHLEGTGQRDETLIVFLSDNGGPCSSNASINAPLRGQKATFLEGGVRVPFIVSWPAHLPSGSVYERPVIALDLAPTFVAAAASGGSSPTGGVRRAPEFDGVDLAPFLTGSSTERPHPTLCWRTLMRTAAIRHDDWKLIRFPDRPAQLYDLSKDISELDDLASKRPEVVSDLLARLYAWELRHEQPPSFLGSINWMRKHMSGYERTYLLTQPE